MTDAGATDDAALALNLFAASPHAFGAMVLRGAGPVRDAMLAYLLAECARHGPVVRLPVNVEAGRLADGVDLAATLASGRAVSELGLIARARGGLLVVPMAERLDAAVAALIAQALDAGSVAALLLDDGIDPDELPPAALVERAAFLCDVTSLPAFAPPVAAVPSVSADIAPLTDPQRSALAVTAAALGIASARPLLLAARAARAHAALHSRLAADDADLAAAVRLVLAPRATQVTQPPPPEPEQTPPDGGEGDREGPPPASIDELDDLLLAAARAALPPHLLDTGETGLGRGGRGAGGRAGRRQVTLRRGRPLGSRAGVPGHGRRLTIIDTLRAAAPWQTIRRQGREDRTEPIIDIRKADLRIRRFEQRRESLTIFAVDASGSSAIARLAEAKGAVELMLAEAYVKRAQVALIAFRQGTADVLLPPTRSLTRARRALAALPGGGGTPLAAGLIAAQGLADAASKRGQTPTIALLTDGKANIARDGSANREVAMAEAAAAARALANAGHHSIVIDISPRPREEAAALAAALHARYLALPQAGSAAMVAAIDSL